MDTFGLKHIIISGLEFTQQTFENHLRATPTTPLANLYDPDPNDPFVGKVYRTGAINEGEADTYAGYVFDTIEIGQHFPGFGWGAPR